MRVMVTISMAINTSVANILVSWNLCFVNFCDFRVSCNGTSMSVLRIVGPEMHAGRVACCPLMSRGEYANGTEGQTDERTDARSLTLRFPLSRRGHRNKPAIPISFWAYCIVYHRRCCYLKPMQSIMRVYTHRISTAKSIVTMTARSIVIRQQRTASDYSVGIVRRGSMRVQLENPIETLSFVSVDNPRERAPR